MLCPFTSIPGARLYVRLLSPSGLVNYRRASSTVLRRSAKPEQKRQRPSAKATAAVPAASVSPEARPQALFKHLGLSQDLLKGLAEHKLLTPSEIQVFALKILVLGTACGHLTIKVLQACIAAGCRLLQYQKSFVARACCWPLIQALAKR